MGASRRTRPGPGIRPDREGSCCQADSRDSEEHSGISDGIHRIRGLRQYCAADRIQRATARARRSGESRTQSAIKLSPKATISGDFTANTTPRGSRLRVRARFPSSSVARSERNSGNGPAEAPVERGGLAMGILLHGGQGGSGTDAGAAFVNRPQGRRECLEGRGRAGNARGRQHQAGRHDQPVCFAVGPPASRRPHARLSIPTLEAHFGSPGGRGVRNYEPNISIAADWRYSDGQSRIKRFDWRGVA